MRFGARHHRAGRLRQRNWLGRCSGRGDRGIVAGGFQPPMPLAVGWHRRWYTGGMNPWSSLEQLSNGALLEETKRLAARERGATVALLAAIAEVDDRCLYLGEGCPSMFVYCTRVLHLSEHAAYDRIQIARLSRRFPVVLEVLESGSLTLTNLRLLAPHLATNNVTSLLADAAGMTRQEVEMLIAGLRPQPPVASTIRRLPEKTLPSLEGGKLHQQTASPPGPDGGVPPRALAGASPSSAPPTVIQPLTPHDYRVQFTISAETREKLRRVQDLMRHVIPNGDVGAIFDRALSMLLQDLQKRRTAAVDRPRSGRATAASSRHIPAKVRREVWKRDAGRCAFVGSQGRCTETGFLELHHVTPYAAGGAATAENIQLRCKPHNAYEAERFFGESAGSFVRESPVEWAVETGPGTSCAPGPIGLT